MIGKENDPGLMFLTIKELFDRVAKTQSDKSYQIKVSFLEIYNEMIRDLLIITNEVLDLREDENQGTHVAGLTVIDVDSPEEVMDLLFFGNGNRTQEATNVNATSSRSHAVLEIQVEQKNKSEDVNEDINIGKLSMIDLAGSERAARTHNRGIRMVEGAMINRSLLSLGNCINALVENMKSGKNHHIPYRDSKLTRLLRDSLGGNSRTVMIANISPSDVCYEDTSNTLKYANRAKNIKTKVTKNIQHVEHHISEYSKIINDLKSEISDLKGRLETTNPPLKMIMSEKDTVEFQQAESNSHKIEEFLDKLSFHFLEETKLVKTLLKFSSSSDTKKILSELRGKVSQDDSMFSQVEKEITLLEESEKGIKAQMEETKQKLEQARENRLEVRKQWEQETIPDYGKKLLELQYEQHTRIITQIRNEHANPEQKRELSNLQNFQNFKDLDYESETIAREKSLDCHNRKISENLSQRIILPDIPVPNRQKNNESPYLRKKREIDDMIAK